MYYICKFSDSWSIYDASNQTSKSLDKAEVECLKRLAPKLLGDTTKILEAVMLTGISPNKLLSLTGSEKNGISKKLAEGSAKS